MTTATAPCFGKLFDANDADCKKCQLNKECQAAQEVGATPVLETAPVTAEVVTEEPPIDLPAPVLEAAEVAAEKALEEEAAAKAAEETLTAEPELAAAPVPAPAKKRGRPRTKKEAAPTKAETPAEAGTVKVSAPRQHTALKTALFKKDADGKLKLASAIDPKDADLVVSAGDIVKIVNPRSKFNGTLFVVSCYSEKYECFRGVHQETKTNADFMPHQIEVIDRAAAPATS